MNIKFEYMERGLCINTHNVLELSMNIKISDDSQNKILKIALSNQTDMGIADFLLLAKKENINAIDIIKLMKFLFSISLGEAKMVYDDCIEE